MKIAGKTLEAVKPQAYAIYRGDDVIELSVSPLPFGWMRRMRLIGMADYPNPPFKVVKLVDGREIRDSKGKLELHQDTGDPQFIRECAQVSELLDALRFATALRNDPNVTWESKEPTTNDKESWVQYAKGIVKELEESSLEQNEIDAILSLSQEMSVSIDPEEGASSFLGR